MRRDEPGRRTPLSLTGTARSSSGWVAGPARSSRCGVRSSRRTERSNRRRSNGSSLICSACVAGRRRGQPKGSALPQRGGAAEGGADDPISPFKEEVVDWSPFELLLAERLL